MDPALDPGTNSAVFEDSEEEMRDERSRDVAFANVQDKLSSRARVVDLINVGN